MRLHTSFKYAGAAILFNLVFVHTDSHFEISEFFEKIHKLIIRLNLVHVASIHITNLKMCLWQISIE